MANVTENRSKNTLKGLMFSKNKEELESVFKASRQEEVGSLSRLLHLREHFLTVSGVSRLVILLCALRVNSLALTFSQDPLQAIFPLASAY